MESFSINLNSKSENKETLKKHVSVLRNKKDPAAILESSECYKALTFINFYLYCPQVDLIKDDILKTLLEFNSLEIFKNLLVHISKSYSEIEFDSIRAEPRFNYYFKTTSLNERRVFMMCSVLRIINLTLPCSLDLRMKFSEIEPLKSLIEILNEKFAAKFYAWNASCFKSVVFNLNWISKICDGFKINWHQLDSVNVLLRSARVFEELVIYFYMIISNVASDKEIESIEGIHFVCCKLVEAICECVRDGRDRIGQSFRDKETGRDLDFEILSWRDARNNSLISVTALLLSLYRLAINQKIKWAIYEKVGLSDALKMLVVNGNDVEKHFALELIAQLCFDERVREETRSDKEFVEFVRRISVKERFEFNELRKSSKQLVWHLDMHNQKPMDLNSHTSNNQVMISYNTKSRELCLKIKEALEKCDYKVWIDVDKIHGSSLDSMAKAVESCEFILICISERYRQSLNCQAEAQYAFRLNKKIIPLIMQKGYSSVDGWLGLIVGDKIYIDFVKYDFDECMNNLRKQLTLIKSSQKSSVSPLNSPRPNNAKSTEKNAARNWSEPEALNWFMENDLNELHEFLKPVNGKVLYELFQLQTYIPEFYYKTLTKNQGVDIKLVARFGSLLRDLFND